MKFLLLKDIGRAKTGQIIDYKDAANITIDFVDILPTKDLKNELEI